MFAKTDPAFGTPNIEYHVQPLDAFSAFTTKVANIRPEGRSAVHIKCPNPDTPPAIMPNYLPTPGYRKVAADGIKLTRQIVAQKALQKFMPEEFIPRIIYLSNEELAKAAGDISTTIFHPAGMVKMGADAMAVVDERLRVHALEGLRVVDASVMPAITSGNTNSTVIRIDEKASDMICEGGKLRQRAETELAESTLCKLCL